MKDGLQNGGFNDDADVGEWKKALDPLEPQFIVPESTEENKQPEDKLHEAKPLSYFQLFRYATYFERLLVVAGVTFGVGTGVCVPFFILLYGEFSSLLVDRNMEGTTSTVSPILSLFGGGRVLVNGTYDERMAAMMEDSVAFAIGAFTSSAVQFLLGVLGVTCMNKSAIHQVSRVRMMFLRALLRQEMSWHDTHGTANVATRLADDLEKLQDGIGEKVAIFVFLVVSFVASVIMALIKGWKLTLVVLSCAPIIIIAQAVVSKMQGSLTVLELESYGAAGAVVEEVLGAIRTVVAFGGEKKEVDRYTDKLDASKKMGSKRGMYSGLGGGIMWFIIYCSYALAFWYGVTLILDDRLVDASLREYTPGIIVIVLFGILAGALNMGMASPHLEAFNIARGAASVVFDIIERQPLIDSLGEEGAKPTRLTGDIEFVGVHFQYPARPDVPVLQGLDLKISRGQTVALVGHSGCGKSTAVQLIQRLYDPEQGTVFIDGVNVRDLNVAWLRSQIGVVGQEPVLFDTTIEENIRYGNPQATNEDIRQAAREANAHDFVSTLPLGYQTMVGERGAQLSGGQKQRIAIARALVRRPAILLLDEATSALDRASEAQVQSALDAASRGRTTLVVAHRLSTVRAADRIVVLSEGRLVEQGTHDELMAAKGHYYELVSVDASTMNTESPIEVQQLNKVSKKLSVTEMRKQSTLAVSKKEDAAEEEESYPAPVLRIMRLNSPEWVYILVGCISSLVVGCSLPGFAVIFGEVYAILSVEDAEEVRATSNIYCILFLVIGILTGLGTFLQTYTFGIVGVRLTNRLRTSSFAAILRQEVGWFDEERNSVGALCARLAGDAASVQGATGSRISVILQSVATLLIGVGVALYFSWKMTLVSIISVPVTLVAVMLEHGMSAAQGLQEKRALEGATRVAVEAVSQLRTVAGLGAELAVLGRYQRELEDALIAGRRRTRLRGLIFAMGQSLPFMCYALSFWYGGVLVATEDMPYENIIIISEALIFGAWMLGQSLAYAPNFGAAKLAAGRLFSILDRQPQISGPSVDLDPKSLVGEVALSHVEFSYPSRPDAKVLRGLDLLVRPGQTVALVGASGCGKSTCIQLLQRFYDPHAGHVRMGEQSIDAVPLRQLRRELGIVSQEPVLFDRTIAENIAYGDNERSPDMTEVISVAKKANIHSFVASLPLGYNTRLGAKGTQLSGGQKQRIAIARALLRNPRLLLLDEATSALDSQSEKVVQAALEQAREGRTCITIAHRLATIQNADLICVLDKGTLAEMGTHSELMRMGALVLQLSTTSTAVEISTRRTLDVKETKPRQVHLAKLLRADSYLRRCLYKDLHLHDFCEGAYNTVCQSVSGGSL